jgi:hypothetical protein
MNYLTHEKILELAWKERQSWISTLLHAVQQHHVCKCAIIDISVAISKLLCFCQESFNLRSNGNVVRRKRKLKREREKNKPQRAEEDLPLLQQSDEVHQM